MRVLLTTMFSPWSAYSGGGQASTHRLATALSDLGHEVHVAYAHPAWSTPPDIPPVPYAVHWLRWSGWKAQRQAAFRGLAGRQLSRLAQAIRPDIVHASGEEAAWMGECPIPLVLTPRYPDYPGRLSPYPLNKFRLLRRALYAADLVAPTSQWAADHVAQFAGRSLPIEVVPNGIADAFLTASRSAGALSGPLLFFGRLEATKGLDVLLTALAQLDDPPPLVVIGRGERVQFEQMADRLSVQVSFEPWTTQQELAKQLAGARLAVLPSREESFGNSVAEAMAVGCPVVTTTAGSLPELVEDGRTGTLVSPGDSQALGDAIRDALAHPQHATEMAQVARLEAHSRFTWPAVARTFADHYTRLLTP